MSFRTATIGDFLKRSKIPLEILDNVKYKRVTIRINHNGVSVRDTELGQKIGTKKQFVLKAGQFILSKIDARYGAFGIAPNEVDNAIITGNFWAYDVDHKQVDIEWFNQFTNSPVFYDVCERASSGITHRKYLDEDTFLNYRITLPDVDGQKVIIDEIKKKKIIHVNLENEITIGKDYVTQLRQAFLREAMQGKLVSQNLNEEPASELLRKIKTSSHSGPDSLSEESLKKKKQKELQLIKLKDIPYEIPPTWIWCRLGEVIEFSNNLNIESKLSSDTIINYVDIDSIDNHNFCIREIKQKRVSELSSRARRVLRKNYILYSLVRPYLNNIAVVEEDRDNFIGSTGFAVFKGVIVENYFIKFLLLSDYIRNIFLELLSGFNSPNITHEQFTQTIIPLPPLAEQHRIVSKLEQLMQFCNELEQNINTTNEQTNLLLQTVLREALEPKEVVN